MNPGIYMKTLDLIAIILLIIGGLNWGLVGLFDFNLVSYIFGSFPLITKLIYDIVGLAAIYKIYKLFTCPMHCEKHDQL